MNSSQERARTPTSSKLLALLLYSTLGGILLLPQLSINGGFHPNGILRADQIIIPLFITFLILLNRHNLRLPFNRFGLGLFLITGIIGTSLIANLLIHGQQFAINDVFDFLIWFTSAIMFVVFGGNLPKHILERAFWVSICLLLIVAIFAALQSVGNQFAVETLGPAFTTRSSRHIKVAPTATTSNPNTLGKLFLIPLFAACALSYRNLSNEEVSSNISSKISWGIVTAIFGYLLLETDSRSALLAAIIGLSVISLALFVGRIGSKRRRKYIIASLFFIMAVSLVLIIFIFDVGRMSNLQNPLQDNSLQIRLRRWKQIMPILLKRPILGHGPANLFRAKVPFDHIDSGVLSWGYHYGIVGIVGYLYFAFGAVQLGISRLIDRDLFQNQPMLWSASAAVTGWFSGTLATWTVAGVPQSRRVFTFALLVAILVTARCSQES